MPKGAMPLMRNMVHSAALAAAVFTATTLGGCREIEQHFLQMGLLHVEPEPAQRSVNKPRHKTVVHRVAKPMPVAAGQRIRHFCGQRHIRFQTGQLSETAQEKARNDVLCSQA